MRHSICAVVLLMAATATAEPVKGAGATTAAPLMKAWSDAYGAGAPRYEANGSTAGREAVTRGEVHFALTDARISVAELAAADLVQFPVLIEGIVPVVNLAGLEPGALKLTGPLLADIFLGKVRMWNSAAIAAENPGLALPALPIQPVYRGDGSGSTFLFTSYLTVVSPEWRSLVGAATSVKWLVGVEAKGSDGIVQKVRTTPGALSYVDFGRARKHGLVHAQLKNRSGEYVSPATDAFAAAAVAAPWATAPSFAVVIVDQSGRGVWPITGSVFAVMRREQKDEAAGREVLKFFDFALGEAGAQVARKHGHVAMPASIARIVRDAWPRLLKNASGTSLWTTAAR
jgi:phosphate transport system substrate-binding protein